MLDTDIFYESTQEDFNSMRDMNRDLLFVSRAVSTHSFDVPSNKDVIVCVDEVLNDLFNEWYHAIFLQVDVFRKNEDQKMYRTRRYFVNQKLQFIKGVRSLGDNPQAKVTMLESNND